METQSRSTACVERQASSRLRGDEKDPIERGLMVAGSPRSGTTRAGRMLALDYRLHYVQEPFNNRQHRSYRNLLGESLAPYARYIPAGTDYPPVTRFLDYVMGRCGELERVDRSPWSDEEQGWFEGFRAQKHRRVKPLIKDPIAILSGEWLRLKFGAPALVMVRHPAEFERSMLRLEWPVGPRWFARQRKFAGTLSEDLVAEIADSLKMPNDALLAEIETYCSEENPDEPGDPSSIHRNSRAHWDRWRAYFNPHEKKLIPEITKPVIDPYGYLF